MDLATLIESGSMGTWVKAGRNEYRICCPHPQHNDRTPSCSINTEKQCFICWSCPVGLKGHVSALFNLLNLDPSTIDLKEVQKTSRTRVHFIDDEVLYTWMYEPTQWVAEGFDIDILYRFGIGYDPYNKRITVPVRDRHGRLTAVSGRATEEWQKARYKFYTKREFLDYVPDNYTAAKGEVLWGQHLLPDVIDRLIVVEGFKAAMWLVQHGVENVVAVMGKDVTDTQLGLISALRVPVTIMFDDDPPGRKGADAIGIKLYQNGVSVSYATLPEGHSPDDLTGDEINVALAEATPHLRRKQNGQVESNREVLPTTQKGKRHGRIRRRRVSLQQRLPSRDSADN